MNDVELLSRLVSYNTVSRSPNADLVHFVAQYLEDAGATVRTYPNSDGTKVNLIAHKGPEEGEGSGVLLSGHVDVVPAKEPDWESDPFLLTEHDDRYVGRGSADMKGFVALAMNALSRVEASALRHPLVLLLTYDEELGSLGAQALSETWDRCIDLPKSAIVGEPTGLRVVRMHKGHLKMRVTTHGRPAHSGCPQLGSNAIEKMGVVIQRLTALARSLEKERLPLSGFFPDTPYAVLNQAMIVGGTATNIVPDRCTLDLGIRLLPGQSSDEGEQRVREVLADCSDWGLHITNDSPPMLTDETAPIHRLMCELMEQRVSYGVPYASDASVLRSMGLDCVLWGPGHIEDAHRANEFISKEQFQRGGELLGQVVYRCCME